MASSAVLHSENAGIPPHHLAHFPWTDVELLDVGPVSYALLARLLQGEDGSRRVPGCAKAQRSGSKLADTAVGSDAGRKPGDTADAPEIAAVLAGVCTARDRETGAPRIGIKWEFAWEPPYVSDLDEKAGIGRCLSQAPDQSEIGDQASDPAAA